MASVWPGAGQPGCNRILQSNSSRFNPHCHKLRRDTPKSHQQRPSFDHQTSINSRPLWFTRILGHLRPTTTKLGKVRQIKGEGNRGVTRLGEVRLTRDGGSRGTAKLDEVRGSGVRWFGEVGRTEKIAEVLQRSLIVLHFFRRLRPPGWVIHRVRTTKLAEYQGSLLPTTCANLGEVQGKMDSERQTTRSLSRDREAEENERKALEELSRAMGQQLGGEDNTGGSVLGDEFVPPVPSNPLTPPLNPLIPVGSPNGSDQTPRPGENTGGGTNFGEEGTQGMMLAMMKLMADMNREMAAERRQTGVKEVVVVDSQRVERKEEKRGEGRQTSAQPAVQATITSTQVKTIPSDADELRRQWPRPPPELREARKKEGKCTECGEKGHWLKDCPVRAAKVKVGWLPPWGEKFGEHGGASGGNAVPLGQRRNLNAVTGEWEGEEEQGKDEDLLLHLLIPSTSKDQPKTDIFINGTKLTTLWDTGATCSYISPGAAAKIGVERRRYPFVEVMFGLKKDAKGRSVRLDVTTLCDADVVIGWDWMRREGVILDGKDNAVKFPIPTPPPPPSSARLAAIGLPTPTDAIDLRDKDDQDELSPEEQEELHVGVRYEVSEIQRRYEIREARTSSGTKFARYEARGLGLNDVLHWRS
ncbi:hypothetical protein TREMEDRAFT_66566 [Tremella mesenterica DSM 1558]|uniref:uncharacterized protein n=1 Tax=Tremella mesenterica (strain ATCC 24925 / CBS 8224 / DSM 1558 / NBRC 9311 / NRRL Y-6157 / RJB 2259-6 / UBC 559-6) TaxID=578456 RepID=UPI00032BFED8|nr:uncharacterized protein TREMEDRAFT_66566 [Tremella mesenterica DSM 1558]EIW65436.1 hypothetical protein TREMEDRAFT_66566 [Tremella mesenterica DSM 1558]